MASQIRFYFYDVKNLPKRKQDRKRYKFQNQSAINVFSEAISLIKSGVARLADYDYDKEQHLLALLNETKTSLSSKKDGRLDKSNLRRMLMLMLGWDFNDNYESILRQSLIHIVSMLEPESDERDVDRIIRAVRYNIKRSEEYRKADRAKVESIGKKISPNNP